MPSTAREIRRRRARTTGDRPTQLRPRDLDPTIRVSAHALEQLIADIRLTRHLAPALRAAADRGGRLDPDLLAATAHALDHRDQLLRDLIHMLTDQVQSDQTRTNDDEHPSMTGVAVRAS